MPGSMPPVARHVYTLRRATDDMYNSDGVVSAHSAARAGRWWMWMAMQVGSVSDAMSWFPPRPVWGVYHDTAPFASCAVVGSSPVLTNGQQTLGQEIDAHDLVMRFNNAPTQVSREQPDFARPFANAPPHNLRTRQESWAPEGITRGCCALRA